MRRIAFSILISVIAAAAARAAEADARKPQLDLRNVSLRIENEQLAGEISYSLVIGTYYEWNTDPTAVPGLLGELASRTRLKARVDFTTVALESAELFRNPMLIMTGNRYFVLTDKEIANLRAYVLAGGFVYVDDCGGADNSFRNMISKIFPDHALEEVPADHPVYTSHYKLSGVPKILDLYNGPAKGYGIFIGGRLAVFYTYDTDVPCGWEKSPDGSFVHLLTPEKHEESLKLGINVVIHALRELANRTARKE